MKEQSKVLATIVQCGAAPIRILAVSHTWQGANDYAFVRAFRRAGHSVVVVSDENFMGPSWRHRLLKIFRRLAMPLLVSDYQKALIAAARALRPQLLFVFKGVNVTARTVEVIRDLGAIAINFYPDVSLTEHGPHIARAITKYDWVFTTKSFHLTDMHNELGIDTVSFLPHAFDPEVHVPVAIDDQDRQRYQCQAAFVGTWTPKKEAMLLHVRRRFPELDLKIWGNQWERATPELGAAVMHQPVLGAEYAKAIRASGISIAMLIEARQDSEFGDLTTARTFEIPAIGGFMLHERTDEAQSFFAEDAECAMFSNAEELVEKLRYYLVRPAECRRIADAGHARCMASGYSVDDRATEIVHKALELDPGKPLARSIHGGAGVTEAKWR